MESHPVVPRIPALLTAASIALLSPNLSEAQPRPPIRRPLVRPPVPLPLRPAALPGTAVGPAGRATPPAGGEDTSAAVTVDRSPLPRIGVSLGVSSLTAPLPLDPITPPDAPPPAAPPAPSTDEAPDRAEITVAGWTDFYYSYNLNQPSNGVNALRLYDARHDHLALNSLALDLNWRVDTISGHTTFQFGALATEFFYPATDLFRAQQELPWRILQEVTLAWSPRLLGRQPLTVEAGVFVAPFGAEYIQIYKNWNWSVSNLFYICPFQLSGVRGSWEFNAHWTVRAGLYAGWDQVLDDNNSGKTVLLQAEYTGSATTFLSVQYMFGAERDRGAREGQWVRHTLDVYGEYQPLDRLQLRAHVFAGAEPNRFGLNAWAAGAVYARVKVFDWLYVAGRGDVVYELVPTHLERAPGTGPSRPLVSVRGASLFNLGDVDLYGSGTGTVEILPHRHLSLRLEFRHDGAMGGLFYRNSVPVEATTREPILNAASQNTLTAGVTAWF